MYPLLATSVEVEDAEEEAEPTAVVTEEIESSPIATEEKTISEKEMDDQFLHLCIRVCCVRWRATVVLSRGRSRGSPDAGVNLQQQVSLEERVRQQALLQRVLYRHATVPYQ